MNKISFLIYALKEPKSTLSNLYWWLYPTFLLKIKYGHIKKYSLTLQHKTVIFTTQDIYSKKWFFPRYDSKSIHEETVTKLFAQNCKNKKEIIDIGSHIGFFTCIAGVLSNANVTGYEIDVRVSKISKKNIQLNNLKKTQIQNIAIGDSNKSITIKTPNTISPALSISEKGDTVVQMKSLDSIYKNKKQKPDLVKIDVEGAEMQVLKGMNDILEKAKPTLFLELHPHNWKSFKTNSYEIIAYLQKYKYETYKIVNLRSSNSNKSNLVEIQPNSKIITNCMIFAK